MDVITIGNRAASAACPVPRWDLAYISLSKRYLLLRAVFLQS
jgi:hypothetical protein